MPSFVGTSSRSSVRSTNTAAARVTASGQFTLPRTCGDVPAKSSMQPIASRTQTPPRSVTGSSVTPSPSRVSVARPLRSPSARIAALRAARRVVDAARRPAAATRSRPSRAMSARKPCAPAAHAASCARRSPRRSSGVRTFARITASMSSSSIAAARRDAPAAGSVPPARAPSHPAACCPGLIPPTSAWCARTAA